MTYIQKGTNEYKLASLALFIGGFVTFSTLYTTQPLLPIISKEFHVSPSTSSLTLSLTTGTLALALLVAAAFSDVIGRKRIMVLSLLSTSLIGVLCAITPNFFSLAMLRGLLGLSMAGVPAIAMTYIVEEFHPKGIGQIMGLYISGTAIGGMTGRILTGVFTDLFHWRISLELMGILSLILSIFFWMILPGERNFTKNAFRWKPIITGYKTHLTDKKLMLLIICPFFIMGSFIIVYNYIGFMLMEPPYNLSQTIIGFLFIVYLSGTYSSILMGGKADHHGKQFILMLSLGLMGAGALGTLVPNLILKIVFLAIFTFGFFAAHSIVSSWVGNDAKTNKAQASSLYLLFYYLGSSLIGSFGGIFWTYFHWAGVVVLIILLLSISYLLIFIRTQMEEKQNKTKADTNQS
ncbi:MFS transporter [Peribacillus saganii]|uniref:MFS transporter n=1 Tax=Peribacillus saganii TaxID=2303992 RepID=A0A372LQY0_9BACI|nr:MFS transporter [Peribacillus saganii]RFU70629.1 MFS transporter [Peribacillus saganii]